MKKNTLAVFDRDEEYVSKLMTYMSDRRSVPLEIQGFTDREKLRVKARDLPLFLANGLASILFFTACYTAAIRETKIAVGDVDMNIDDVFGNILYAD